MASISSTSTLDEIRAAYLDNVGYAEDGSATKCRAFITACRALLLRMPAEQGTRESHQKMNPELIQKEIAAAESWLTATGNSLSGGSSGGATSGSLVTRADFRNFRG